MTTTTPAKTRRTERILQASAYVAAQLIHAASWESCIDNVLARIGHAVGSDLVYLIQVCAPDVQPVLDVHSHWWSPYTRSPIPVEQLALTDWAASTFAPWVEKMRARQPISGRTADLPPAQRALLEELRVDALHLLPVFAGQTWWGMILLDGSGPAHNLNATEFDALCLAADSLGSAIDRQQAELKLHRRNHELHVLNSVIAAATASLEPHSVLRTTCHELARAFQASTAGAALVDETGRALEIVAEYVTPGHFSALGHKIPIEGNSSTEYVMRERKPLVVDDVQHDPRMSSIRDLLAQRGVASIMILPLTAGDEVVGTLGLDSNLPRHFGDEEVALAMSATAAASQVLAKARMLAAERENTARLGKILELSTRLAGLRDEKELLHTLAQNAVHFSPSGICTIFMTDDETASVVLCAQAGLSDDLLNMRIPQSHPVVQYALRQQTPIVVPDVDRDAPQLRSVLVLPEINAFYAYPFISESGPLGFITFSSRAPRRPPPAEISALSLLAERAAAALNNVRLLHAVSAQATQLSALHEVDVAISTSLEPEEVYDTIAHSAAQLLSCDLVNLYTWLPEQDQLVGLATYGPPEKSVKSTVFSGDMEPNLLFFRSHRLPIAISDATTDSRVAAYWRERNDMHAVLLVPLFYREELSGLLACNDTRHTRRWTPAEIALAQALAAQAAIAVANARLHAETRELLTSSRQQARTVQQIVDTVADGLLLLDPQHAVVVANPVAQEFLDRHAQFEDDRLVSLAGVPLSHLLITPGDDRPSHELHIGSSRYRIFEVRARQMEAEPLAGSWVIALHEATREREQLAYLQAQDRLATVGQLAAGIAHDFNNILAVIVLYAQTLQRDDVPARDRERLRAIYQQAQRASSLIAQILDFSRRSVVERRAVELEPFLEELAQMLQRTLPETITVQLELATNAIPGAAIPGATIVNVDPTRLQQALMNLALNARDAMGGKSTVGHKAGAGGVLRLALVRLDASWQPPLPDMKRGDWIAITVADTGAGIKEEILPHIFEPFFTTKMPGQGTGLGLAQVYGIVKQHDGYIDVHSSPGSGSAFTIYLPPLHVAPAPDLPIQPTPTTGKGELILVVEDELAIQNAVREILHLLGYTVLLASDGQQALEIYHEAAGDIDLVLSDMVMPRMDGAQLYHALRRHNPQIKLVLFTGYPLDEAGKTFVEDEGVAWIQKPFNAETLDAVIRRALDAET